MIYLFSAPHDEPESIGKVLYLQVKAHSVRTRKKSQSRKQHHVSTGGKSAPPKQKRKTVTFRGDENRNPDPEDIRKVPSLTLTRVPLSENRILAAPADTRKMPVVKPNNPIPVIPEKWCVQAQQDTTECQEGRLRR
ncbi:uncharacterized protein LOC120350623 isoform X2 [Nilaparvata lugens]|uniref:uncharacterized protein LOC120350623 isoform X2 n=1 Tax=Nilaparvata lugens TaxID=108931 RepID=UPI00193DAE1C|nr:uncharacterized protein LOC120350623 isoform X2 [Nilaparvata lugens]